MNNYFYELIKSKYSFQLSEFSQTIKSINHIYEDVTNVQNNKPLSYQKYGSFGEERISSILEPDAKYLIKYQSKTFQEIEFRSSVNSYF